MVVAAVVNAVVGWAATRMGAPDAYGPLTVPAQASFTVAGIAVAWVGWRMIIVRANDPRRVLWTLVPTVTLLSFVPDILLLGFRFIPGTDLQAVAGLMIMHIVVATCAPCGYFLIERDSSHRTRPVRG